MIIKHSPFLITDSAVNQLTLVAAYDPTVTDLINLWYAAKDHLKDVEALLAVELAYHLNGVSRVTGNPA